MNIKELLNKELSFEEINEVLHEVMGYSCSIPEDSSECVCVYDEDGDPCNFRRYIGMSALNTLSGILFFKEKIDEERGEFCGRIKLQKDIKKLLAI